MRNRGLVVSWMGGGGWGMGGGVGGWAGYFQCRPINPVILFYLIEKA